jgi:UDP-N-acetylmuramyl tripeptide synthase
MSPFLMPKRANNCETKQATEVLPCHGTDYIEQAIDKGCVCVLIDSKDFECGVPTIRIDNLSTHLVTLAQQMHGDALKAIFPVTI